MKKHTVITSFILCFIGHNVLAQVTSDDLEKRLQPINTKLNSMQAENDRLKHKTDSLSYQLNVANKRLDSIQEATKANSNAITQTADELGVQIQQTGKVNDEKISAVDQSLGKNSLYGIIVVLLVLLVSGGLFFVLRKRQRTDKTDLADQLSKTKSSIEESLIKEFGKQTDAIENQLQLLEKQKVQIATSPNFEPDHSLALKLASEINLIERNISLMDAGTKGLKQLQRSVGKLKDNLAANGYEMPELLGKSFNQGMKLMVVSSVPDETKAKESETITKIILPQVNYNNKMIQAAQVEVTVGV